MLTRILRRKPFFCAVLAFALLAFTCATAALTASANETANRPYKLRADAALFSMRTGAEAHRHAMSVDCETAGDNLLDFQPLTQAYIDELEANATNAVYLPEGNYYLAEDILLKKDLTVQANSSLCLNGQIMTKQGDNAVITLAYNQNTTFSICDCQPNRPHDNLPTELSSITGGLLTRSNQNDYFYGGGIRANQYACYNAVHCTLNMYGGTIAGHNSSSGDGAGVNLVCANHYQAEATFNMYGGKICYNSSGAGTGVTIGSNHSYFNMYGGEISHNKANGYSGGNGGGVKNSGIFTLYDGIIAYNSAAGTSDSSGKGGGIFNIGNLIIKNGTISNNTAQRVGGGICNYNSSSTPTCKMYGGKITNNTAEQYGGGVYVNHGSFLLQSGTISHNNAQNTQNSTTCGGGVYVYRNANLNIDGGEISHNSASNGGGIYADYSSTTEITNGEISHNTVPWNGGGIHNKGTLAINGGNLLENTAQNGGAVYNDSPTDKFTISNGKISGNKAEIDGGAVFTTKTMILCGGQITNNTAGNTGGGIRLSDNSSSSVVSLYGSPQIYDNTAGSQDSLTPNNVYIGYHTTTGTNPSYDRQTIAFSSDTDLTLADDAIIGVYYAVSPEEGESFSRQISSDDNSKYNNYGKCFFTDNPPPAAIESRNNRIWFCSKLTSSGHTHYGDTTAYTPISDFSAPLAPGGYYYLTAGSAITLTDPVEINGSVHLCLNGASITPPEGKPVFTVKTGASLQLSGCSAETVGRLINNGSIVVEPGGKLEIINNKTTNDAGAIVNKQVIEATTDSITTEVNESGQIAVPATHQEIHEEYTGDHTKYDKPFYKAFTDGLDKCKPAGVEHPEGRFYRYLPEGNYYMTENVTLDMALEVHNITNLCLYNHDLTAYNEKWEYDMDHVFWVPDKAVLNILDCLNDLTIIWLPGGSVHLRNGGRVNIIGHDGSQINFAMTDGENGGGTVNFNNETKRVTLPKGLEVTKTVPDGQNNQVTFSLRNDGQTFTMTGSDAAGSPQTTKITPDPAAGAQPVLAPILELKPDGSSEAYVGDKLLLPDKTMIQNQAGDRITLQQKPDSAGDEPIGALASGGQLTTNHSVSVLAAASSPEAEPLVITSPAAAELSGGLTVEPTGEITAPTGSTVTQGDLVMELSTLPLDDSGNAQPARITPTGEISLPLGSRLTATLPADPDSPDNPDNPVDPDNPDNPGRGRKTIVIALPEQSDGGEANIELNPGGLTLPGGSEITHKRGSKTIVIALPRGQEADVWYDDQGKLILPEGTEIADPDKPGENIIIDKDHNTYDPETGDLSKTEELPEKPDKPDNPDNPDKPDKPDKPEPPQNIPTGGSTTADDGSQISRPDEDTVVITPAAEGKPTVTIKNEPQPGGDPDSFEPKVDKEGNVHLEAPFSVKTDDDQPEIKVADSGSEPAIVTPQGEIELPKGGTLEITPPGSNNPGGNNPGGNNPGGNNPGGNNPGGNPSDNPIKITVPEGGGKITPQPDGTISLPPNSRVEIDGQVTQIGSQGGTLNPGDKTVSSNSGGSGSGGSGGGGGGGGAATETKQDSFEITASASFGGSISPSGQVAVAGGSDQSFRITPQPGYVIEAVIVDAKNIGTPAEYTFEKVQAAHRIEAIFAAGRSSHGHSGCPKDETCPIWPYTDAIPTDWYHDGVHYCIENGLMIGTAPELWEPNIPLTRGMLAQVLYNRAGKPEVVGAGLFDDVADTGEWYWPAITWGGRNGVVLGYGNGCFGPKDPVTREQLATMLWRYAGKPQCQTAGSLSDAGQISGWAAEAVAWAYQAGIVKGYPDGSFRPQGFASRAEAAQMIQRYFAR